MIEGKGILRRLHWLLLHTTATIQVALTQTTIVCCRILPTHGKISQLVASLQTNRQQVVFARLVTSCQ